jgi:putative NADH-flavin reductase
MKLTVFGATGGTGKQVVIQACEAGHQVTAVVRDPARLAVEHPNLTVIQADVMDPASIESAIAGRHAVVTAIGSRGLKPSTVTADSTASIVKAMAATGVRRLVTVSNSGMFTDGDDLLTRTVVKPIAWRFLKHPWNDALRAEEVVRASDLDWTLTRPPRLTDKPRTGSYRTAVGRNVRFGFTVSRADVADVILRCLQDPASIRTAISLAN